MRDKGVSRWASNDNAVIIMTRPRIESECTHITLCNKLYAVTSTMQRSMRGSQSSYRKCNDTIGGDKLSRTKENKKDILRSKSYGVDQVMIRK